MVKTIKEEKLPAVPREFSFKNFRAQLALAETKMQEKSIDEAIDIYQKAIADFPYLPDGYLGRAKAFMESGKISRKTNLAHFVMAYVAALSECIHALELTPLNLTAHKLYFQVLSILKLPAYQNNLSISMLHQLAMLEATTTNPLTFKHVRKKLHLALTADKIEDEMTLIKKLGDEEVKFRRWYYRLLSATLKSSKDPKLLASPLLISEGYKLDSTFTNNNSEDVMLGLAAYYKNDLILAYYYFENAKNKFPNDVLSLLYLSDIYFRHCMQHNMPLTEAHLTISKIANAFNFSYAHALSGLAYAKLGTYNEAAKSFISALKKYTSNDLDYFNSMQQEIYKSLKTAGKLVFTLKDTGEFPATVPKPLELAKHYEDTAERCFEIGAYDDALLYYSLAIWYEDERRLIPNPKLEHLYRMRAHIYLLQNNSLEANYNLAFAKDNANSPAEFITNSALDEIERLARHTKSLHECFPSLISPNFNEYMIGIRAYELFKETSFQDIPLEILNNLIDQFPDFTDAYFYRAQLLNTENTVLADLEKGLSLSPLNVDFLNKRISINTLSGNNDSVALDQVAKANSLKQVSDFQKIFTRAMKQHISPELGIKEIMYVSLTFLGMEAFEVGNYKLAIFLFSKALMNSKYDFIAQTYRGLANFFSGNIQGAQIDLEYCIKTYKYSRAYFGRALLYLKAKDYKKAGTNFIDALKHCTKDDYELFRSFEVVDETIKDHQEKSDTQIISVNTIDFYQLGVKELDNNSPWKAKFYLTAATMICDPKLLHTYYLSRSIAQIQLKLPEKAKDDIENSIKIATYKKIPNEDITIISSTFSQKCYEAVSSRLYKTSTELALQFCHLGLNVYPTPNLYLARARLYVNKQELEAAKTDIAKARELSAQSNIPLDKANQTWLDEFEAKPVVATNQSNQFPKKKKSGKKSKQSFQKNPRTTLASTADEIQEPTPVAAASSPAPIAETKEEATAVINDIPEVAEPKVAEPEIETPKLVLASPASHIARNKRRKARKQAILSARKGNNEQKLGQDRDVPVKTTNNESAVAIITPAVTPTAKTGNKTKPLAPVNQVAVTKKSYADIIRATIEPTEVVTAEAVPASEQISEAVLPASNDAATATSDNNDTFIDIQSPKANIVAMLPAEVATDGPVVGTVSTATTSDDGNHAIPEIKSLTTRSDDLIETTTPLKEVSTQTDNVTVIKTEISADNNTTPTERPSLHIVPPENTTQIIDILRHRDVATETAVHKKSSADSETSITSADIPAAGLLKPQVSAIATTDNSEISSPRSTLHGSDTDSADEELLSSPFSSPAPTSTPPPQNNSDDWVIDIAPSPVLMGESAPNARENSTPLPTLDNFMASVTSPPKNRLEEKTAIVHPRPSAKPPSVFFQRRPESPLRSLDLTTFIADYYQLFNIEQAFFREIAEYEQAVNEKIGDPQDQVYFKTFIVGGSVFDRILDNFTTALKAYINLPIEPMLRATIINYLKMPMFDRYFIVDDIDIITELPKEIIKKIADKLGMKLFVGKRAAENSTAIPSTQTPNIDFLSFTYTPKRGKPIKFDFVYKAKIILSEEAEKRTSGLAIDRQGRKIDFSGHGIHDLICGKVRVTNAPVDKHYQIEPLKFMHAVAQSTKRKLKISDSNTLKSCNYDMRPITPSYINSGLQKLFSKNNVCTNYYKLHDYGFIDAVFGLNFSGSLKDDDAWIKKHLITSDLLEYPSLRYIYCLFIVSFIMQYAGAMEQAKIQSLQIQYARKGTPFYLDVLQSYEYAFSEENLLTLASKFITDTPLLQECMGTSPYEFILKRYINDRKEFLQEHSTAYGDIVQIEPEVEPQRQMTSPRMRGH
jgi:tetratricopeptide (TPR) repeat protein